MIHREIHALLRPCFTAELDADITITATAAIGTMTTIVTHLTTTIQCTSETMTVVAVAAVVIRSGTTIMVAVAVEAQIAAPGVCIPQ